MRTDETKACATSCAGKGREIAKPWAESAALILSPDGMDNDCNQDEDQQQNNSACHTNHETGLPLELLRRSEHDLQDQVRLRS